MKRGTLPLVHRKVIELSDFALLYFCWITRWSQSFWQKSRQILQPEQSHHRRKPYASWTCRPVHSVNSGEAVRKSMAKKSGPSGPVYEIRCRTCNSFRPALLVFTVNSDTVKLWCPKVMTLNSSSSTRGWDHSRSQKIHSCERHDFSPVFIQTTPLRRKCLHALPVLLLRQSATILGCTGGWHLRGPGPNSGYTLIRTA